MCKYNNIFSCRVCSTQQGMFIIKIQSKVNEWYYIILTPDEEKNINRELDE